MPSYADKHNYALIYYMEMPMAGSNGTEDEIERRLTSLLTPQENNLEVLRDKIKVNIGIGPTDC